MDGAIGVVSNTYGRMLHSSNSELRAPTPRPSIQFNIRKLVVSNNKINSIGGPEMLEVVLRDLLSVYEFGGENMPIVGSASAALKGLEDRPDRTEDYQG